MIETSIVYRNMKKYNFFKMSKADGSFLWDRNGKKYIDFTSAWNVTNLGWNNPEIKDALVSQANKNVQGLLWGSDPIQEDLAAKLISILPHGLDACTKATGGTEAIEEAIKISRAATGKKKIIGFKKSYHGQLFASLAIGSPYEIVEKISPLVPECLQMDFPTIDKGEENFKTFLEDMEKTLSNEDVAALVTEPGILTGWGSTLIAYPGFLKELRKITKEHDALLIVDEVGTGFSRTGKLFGVEHDKVTPDMIVLAKALSNGAAAIGTVVGRSEIFESSFPYTNLISTFGWTPIACAASLKACEIHLRERTWEKAETNGKYMLQELKKSVGKSVVDIQGMGMEIGIRLKDAESARKVIDASFEKGLHVVVGSENNIQLMPPLTISKDLLDKGIEILAAAIDAVCK